MAFLKCEVCAKKATWYDLSSMNGIKATCNKHLPLNCDCDDCIQFVDLDENGKRTEPCNFLTSWSYNKRGWKPIRGLKGCVEEC